MLKALIFRLFRPYLAKHVFVVYIIDGDTFLVQDRAANQFKVRLWGVDAYELSQPLGLSAKLFARSILERKWVVLKFKDKDVYGRCVCQVYVNNSDFSKLILKEGLAVALSNSSLTYKLYSLFNKKIFQTNPTTHRKSKKRFFW